MKLYSFVKFEFLSNSYFYADRGVVTRFPAAAIGEVDAVAVHIGEGGGGVCCPDMIEAAAFV